ncbi:hypothetical protein EVAR_79368_1 [Eumeta japonica]|uniref:Uncharacterized protein n=1 Tax=Eumeta variegata TaxID=151549 RepID=A0A4C1TIB3_EUMVA|nr:hypothetical protein EVAR_79368_1 [Eumeta japonica]
MEESIRHILENLMHINDGTNFKHMKLTNLHETIGGQQRTLSTAEAAIFSSVSEQSGPARGRRALCTPVLFSLRAAARDGRDSAATSAERARGIRAF